MDLSNLLYYATRNQFRGYPTAVILSPDGSCDGSTGYLSKGECS